MNTSTVNRVKATGTELAALLKQPGRVVSVTTRTRPDGDQDITMDVELEVE
jgi:hypothetical protein